MLQINNRNGEVYTNIEEIHWDSRTYGGKNQIQIAGFHKELLGKIALLRDEAKLIDSGIIEGYQYNKNENKTILEISPLIYDLRRDFVRAENGDYIRYYDDKLENVLRDIIEQYRRSTENPLLYLKKLPATWITVKYSFEYKDWLSAFNVLLYKFLPIEKNIKVWPDGGIEIILEGKEYQLIYGEDVYKIAYKENADGIINSIIFDNKIPWSWNIRKTYEDAESIKKYGKRVKYRDDARIKHVETIDSLVSAFFSKNARPNIEVESITTPKEIWIYDKITISNWEKGFDDQLYVTGIIHKKGEKKELKVWTSPTRSILAIDEWDSESIYKELRNEMANINVHLPEYIKETHIESTEIRSPVIAGNQWYFAQKVRVGQNGIIIDGEKKQINSSNYNPEHNSGFMMNDSGQFLFGGNNSNYIKWNGNLLELRGLIKSTLYDNYGETPQHQDGLLWANNSALSGHGKVLWGYFGGIYQKQQISMSRMQEAWSFDVSGKTMTEEIDTWFQPRFILFNGFFENVGKRIWGTSNGQAGIESYQQGLCNYLSLKQDMQSVVDDARWGGDWHYIVMGGNLYSAPLSGHSAVVTDGDIGWRSAINEISKINIGQLFPQCGYVGDKFACNDYNGQEAWAQVTERKDNGIKIKVKANSGWRISGNIFILW